MQESYCIFFLCSPLYLLSLLSVLCLNCFVYHTNVEIYTLKWCHLKSSIIFLDCQHNLYMITFSNLTFSPAPSSNLRLHINNRLHVTKYAVHGHHSKFSSASTLRSTQKPSNTHTTKHAVLVRHSLIVDKGYSS